MLILLSRAEGSSVRRHPVAVVNMHEALDNLEQFMVTTICMFILRFSIKNNSLKMGYVLLTWRQGTWGTVETSLNIEFCLP